MAFYTVEPFKKLLLFLLRLQRAKIHYSLAQCHDPQLSYDAAGRRISQTAGGQ